MKKRILALALALSLVLALVPFTPAAVAADTFSYDLPKDGNASLVLGLASWETVGTNDRSDGIPVDIFSKSTALVLEMPKPVSLRMIVMGGGTNWDWGAGERDGVERYWNDGKLTLNWKTLGFDVTTLHYGSSDGVVIYIGEWGDDWTDFGVTRVYLTGGSGGNGGTPAPAPVPIPTEPFDVQLELYEHDENGILKYVCTILVKNVALILDHGINGVHILGFRSHFEAIVIDGVFTATVDHPPYGPDDYTKHHFGVGETISADFLGWAIYYLSGGTYDRISLHILPIWGDYDEATLAEYPDRYSFPPTVIDPSIFAVGTDTQPAPAEENSLANFTRPNTYTPGTFTDVAAGQWYADWARRAYEYGIIQGIGNNRFDPGGTLTGAQALTIAARIHAVYKYGAAQAESKIQAFKRDGDRWFDIFVLYCKAEGLIGNELDDKMDTPVTRAEMVFTWSKLLEAKDMTAQNTVNSLPDVNADTPYLAAIMLFYEAGIVGGVDSAGTFNPNNNITRAEAATIFMRLVDEPERITDRTFGEPGSIPPTSNASDFEREVFRLTNFERQKYGLPPLAWHEELAAVARAHSVDMATRGFISHNDPDGVTPWDRVRNAGIADSCAENLARGQRTPEEVVAAWMNSPGHAANILNGDISRIGVGFYDYHWTQKFLIAEPDQIDAATFGQDLLALINAERVKHGITPLIWDEEIAAIALADAKKRAGQDSAIPSMPLDVTLSLWGGGDRIMRSLQVHFIDGLDKYGGLDESYTHFGAAAYIVDNKIYHSYIYAARQQPQQSTQINAETFGQDLLRLINIERATHGQRPLVWDNDLASAAQAFCAELAVADSLLIFHDPLEGYYGKLGTYTSVGATWCNSMVSIEAFVSSSNFFLDETLTHIGAGIQTVGGVNYHTIIFIARSE
jgi:uncharacterized protein YkwD